MLSCGGGIVFFTACTKISLCFSSFFHNSSIFSFVFGFLVSTLTYRSATVRCENISFDFFSNALHLHIYIKNSISIFLQFAKVMCTSVRVYRVRVRVHQVQSEVALALASTSASATGIQHKCTLT